MLLPHAVHSSMKHYPRIILAVSVGLALMPAYAVSESVLDDIPADDARLLDTLIVTGTRVSDRTLAQSQSPIDIITPETLQASGSLQLSSALARVLPSLNFPRPTNSDGTTGVRPAQLRGLAPDQVLVLVNGKRRHLSAWLDYSSNSIGRGTAPVDFNAIPVAAIERVEVLRDGASAQYGSDAIAGVINVVLKDSRKGGSVQLDGGIYSAGDGEQYRIAADAGAGFADGRGSVHVSLQRGWQNKTNRAFPYQGDAPHTGPNPGVGEKRHLQGEPDIDDLQAALNGNFRISDALEIYATALVGNRENFTPMLYRSRGHNPIVPQFFPDGYVTLLNQYIQNRSLVTGAKGQLAGGFGYDLSVNHGVNHMTLYTLNSLNYDLGANSPNDFYDGALEYTHHLANADFSLPLNIGLEWPALLSFGAEYRAEKWNESPGTPESYNAQAYSGFTAADAIHSTRHNHALYVGLEADISEAFSAGIAGRHEDYSDFGSKFSGKLSARYALGDALALRTTLASGFRAPSLAQQHYQNISPQYRNGTFYNAGTYRVGDPVAIALGASPLKPETSLSYSVGLVLQPGDALYLTVDAYQINIDDRIILSSNLNVEQSQAAQAILRGLGVSGVGNIRYFNNAVDTRTRGVDVVGNWRVPFSAGRLNLSWAWNWTQTRITRIASNPAALDALGLNLYQVGRDERGRIEEGFPRNKLVLGASWTQGNWTWNLGASRYGPIIQRISDDVPDAADNDQFLSAQWLLDVSASVVPAAGWKLSLGVDNVLDQHPDQVTFSTYGGQLRYSGLSPFGANGAYVYARIGYEW